MYIYKECYKLSSPQIYAALKEVSMTNGTPLFPKLRDKLSGFRLDGKYIIVPKSIKISLSWLADEYCFDNPEEYELFKAWYGNFTFKREPDVTMLEYMNIPPYVDAPIDPNVLETCKQNPDNILDDLLYKEYIEEYNSLRKYFISDYEFAKEVWPNNPMRFTNIPKDIYDMVPNYVKKLSCGFGEYCMEDYICYLVGIKGHSLKTSLTLLGIIPLI